MGRERRMRKSGATRRLSSEIGELRPFTQVLKLLLRLRNCVSSVIIGKASCSESGGVRGAASWSKPHISQHEAFFSRCLGSSRQLRPILPKASTLARSRVRPAVVTGTAVIVVPVRGWLPGDVRQHFLQPWRMTWIRLIHRAARPGRVLPPSKCHISDDIATPTPSVSHNEGRARAPGQTCGERVAQTGGGEAHGSLADRWPGNSAARWPTARGLPGIECGCAGRSSECVGSSWARCAGPTPVKVLILCGFRIYAKILAWCSHDGLQ